MIEVKNLTKSFDGFRALDGLELHVPGGAVYGLVGPNGSGKSTAIRHITGVYRPDSGSVCVLGKPVYENPEVKSRIAYIPDEQFSFLQASVNDMMRLISGLYPRFSKERFEKLAEAFPLDRKTPIRRLSKGMQKQAAFWLSLSLCPEVLVLDEPVDGLDPVMRRQVWSLILSDVAENGTTVLVSSHNLRELEDVCDHVGILSHGKLLLERSLAELQDNIVKLQFALQDDTALPPELEKLPHSVSGRMHTLIVRGNADEVVAKLAALSPYFIDRLPLTLEEIFVYELGGEDYHVKDILL